MTEKRKCMWCKEMFSVTRHKDRKDANGKQLYWYSSQHECEKIKERKNSIKKQREELSVLFK